MFPDKLHFILQTKLHCYTLHVCFKYTFCCNINATRPAHKGESLKAREKEGLKNVGQNWYMYPKPLAKGHIL